MAVSDLLVNGNLSAVLALGDIGNEDGALRIYQESTVDITPLVTSNSTFSLASRESGANAPQLIVTTR